MALEWLSHRPSLYQTLIVINDYLNSGEQPRRCFTYRGIRAYWTRNKLWDTIEYHTLTRNIRKLVELGYLKRIYIKHMRARGSRTIYCPTQRFYDVIKEREKVVGSGG